MSSHTVTHTHNGTIQHINNAVKIDKINDLYISSVVPIEVNEEYSDSFTLAINKYNTQYMKWKRLNDENRSAMWEYITRNTLRGATGGIVVAGFLSGGLSYFVGGVVGAMAGLLWTGMTENVPNVIPNIDDFKLLTVAEINKSMKGVQFRLIDNELYLIWK